MKSQLRFFIVVILMVLLVILTIGKVSTVVYVNQPNGIASTPSSFKIVMPVYFMNADALLVAEDREITIRGNDMVTTLFSQLKTSPQQDGLHNVVEANVMILSSETVNKKLYLNLSSDLAESTFWKRGYHDIVLYSIVNTLTQFESIERVQIKIEGRDINAYVSTDKKYSDLFFNDALIYKLPLTPRDIVKSFLDYIMIERYDLAFNMIAQTNGLEYIEDDLTTEMSRYRSLRSSYDEMTLFTKKDDQDLIVVVKYQYTDESRNIIYDGGVEEWHLVQEGDNQYKIIWPLDME